MRNDYPLSKGMKIANKEHKEWGVWIVLREYDTGIYEIRGGSGEKCLFADEFYKFWEIV